MASATGRTRPAWRRRAVFGFLGAPALIIIAQLFGPSANALNLTIVSATVTPKIQFLNDTAGTTFTFTVTNASPSQSIGAVSIQRPSPDWTVVDCPQAPAGWSATSNGSQCLYRSASGRGDDIPTHRSSSAFQVRATTAPGAANRAGGWRVQASSSSFMPESGQGAGSVSGGSGLTTTAYSVELLDAVVANGPATVGGACPPSSKSAITGTTRTIVLCGRNRTSGPLTMTQANSSMGGTFLASTGTFAGAPVAANSGASTVLANWDATITGTKSTGRTIVASLGASAGQTSPQPTPPNTTFTGYQALNQTPVAAATSATTLEDQPTTVALSATDGDGDSTLNNFAIASGPANGSLGTITPGSCSGGVPNTCTATVTYTPTANANGSDSFTYTASDSFSTSSPATASLTITPVNDAPSFSKGSDQTVNEDSGPSSVGLWATSISAGPSDESSQTIAFNVTGNTNPGLFSSAPAVAPDGTLTYTPAANANGSATITIAAQDSGGTTDGGADTSGTQTFVIHVTPANDPPSFTKGSGQTVLEDAGPRTVNTWATAISPGPADESGQTVSFGVTTNNDALFSTLPAVDNSGALTYTAAPNANGTATVTVTATDDGTPAASSAPQTFVIDVTAVNDAPTFGNGGNQTSLEDGVPFTNPDWAVPVSPGAANEASQSVAFTVTNNTNTGLFTTQPAVAPNGMLSYTSAPDANGVATITVVAHDNGGTTNGGVDTSSPQVFNINVTPVNDAPSFTKGADQTVLEDAGPQTVSPWATNMSTGPADENAQVQTFNVTDNTNSALFSTAPAVDSNGVLSYTPAANANGTATITLVLQDSGGTTHGGADTSAPQSFEINVTAVNDAPSFTKGADQTLLEDAVAQTAYGWATDVSPGPADESGQVMGFNVTVNTGSALFSAGPAVDSLGNLSYTLAPDANGTATISITATDNGGTADGGADTSAPQSFEVNVTAVNDAPSFTKGADQTVQEDSGAWTVNGWATGISPGPADESGQTVSMNVTSNSNSALFSAGPAVDSSGNLTYTPAADANGSATITITASDSGGTTHGGADTSGTQTFVITVTAVNDAPSFTKGADQTVQEDSGAHTVNGWATGISPGPADEAGQTVAFNVTSNANPSLFSTAPAIDSSGKLTYTLAPNANGSATIVIAAQDNGGTADGGADTSAPQTFDINVTPVNDAPSFTKGADQTLQEDAGPQTVNGWATDISPGPADESAQGVTFGATNDNNALFSTQPSVAPNGTLSYTPAANANGSATVTVTATDDGSPPASSAPQTFTIDVASVNDAPSFTKGGDQTNISTDAAQSVPDWATNISKGPADEAGQTVAFNVTGNTNPGLFSSGPAIAPDGTLSYTLAGLGHDGVATITVGLQDNGGTANGGADTSAPQTFTITVNPPNHAPEVANAAISTLEETAKTFTMSATDADGDALTFAIVSNPAHGTLGSPGLIDCTTTANTCTQTIVYTPATNYNGPDSFSYKANDGQADSDVALVSITVDAVNDAPVNTVPAAQTVNEDTAKTFSSANGNALSTSDVDAGSSPVTVTVGVLHGTVTLGGTTDLTISGNGTGTVQATGTLAALNTALNGLSYKGNLNFNGPDTLTMLTNDNGNTGSGGAQTDSDTVTITVEAVNDGPVNTVPGAQAVDEDTAVVFKSANSNVLSTSDVDAGTSPVKVTVGVLHGTVTLGGTTNLTVTGDGTATVNATGKVADLNTALSGLTYQGVLDYNGPDTLTITTNDQGNTGTGGALSDTDTVAITVSAVNDAPVASADTFTGANSALAGTRLAVGTTPIDSNPVVGISGSVLSNDTDVDSSGLTATVASAATGQGGTVTMNTNGSFVYVPAAGFVGTDTFNYVLHDNETPDATDTDTARTLVSINVVGPKVWYVKAGAPAGGNGTSTSPFNSLAPLTTGGSADTLDGTGDIIFLYQGTYPSGIVLESGQKLWGASQGLIVTDALTPARTHNLVAAVNGATTTVQGGSGTAVTLSTNNDVEGVTLTGGTTTLAGANVNGATIGATVAAPVAINNAAGNAVDVSSGTVNMVFTSVSSAGGSSSPAVNLAGISGTFNAGSGTITSAVGGFGVSGGAATITYTGNITASGTGRSMSIASRTGGTATFTGVVTDTGAGISLLNNTGSTTKFNGTLSSKVTGANNAFVATGGGNLEVTGATNELSAATGRSLQVEGTTVTASGLTFRTIANSGSTTNGIRLANTGTAATTTLTVTGTSSPDSGGIITGTAGPGISLDTVKGVSLTRVKVQNGGDDGVSAAHVNGFTLADSTVQNNGNTVGENGLDFTDVSGTLAINTTAVTGSYYDNVSVNNTTGTAIVTFSAATITGAQHNNGVEIVTSGGLPSSVTASVVSPPSATASVFSNNAATGFSCLGSGSGSTLACNVLGATLANNNIGLDIDQAANAHVTFDVENNTLNNHFSHAMNYFSSSTSAAGSTFTGKILNNTIGTVGTKDSGSAIGSGVRIIAQGLTDTAVRLANNTIREIPNAMAIDIEGRAGTGGLDATVLGNAVVAPTGTNQTICDGTTTTMCPADVFHIEANGGNSVCANVSGNTGFDPTLGLGGGFAYRLKKGATSSPTFLLEGTQANAQTQITTTNTGAPVSADPTITMVAPGTCTQVP
jgi:hypothetical protein